MPTSLELALWLVPAVFSIVAACVHVLHDRGSTGLGLVMVLIAIVCTAGFIQALPGYGG